MTKYLVSGYIGFDNFGDEAIAKVLVSYLKSKNAEKITLISSNPKKTSKLYEVNSVGMLNFFRALIDCDVLISGGGSLLQDITSLKSLIYYLAIIFLAIVFRKKVIIFAQGFTPFRTKLGKVLTQFVLKKCDEIYIRDEKSQDLLNQMGIGSNLVSDPVYGIDVNPQKHSGVGVQLRDFYKLNAGFLNKLAKEIEKKFKDKEIKLISLQDNLDLAVLNKFSKILDNLNIKNRIYSNLSVEDGVKILSELEYLIGMRFHANLIASKSRVKILGINYDVKVSTLAEKVGFPIIELDSKNIEDGFKNFLDLDVEKYKIPQFDFPNIA